MIMVWAGDTKDLTPLWIAGGYWLLFWKSPAEVGFRRILPRIGVVFVALLLGLIYWVREQPLRWIEQRPAVTRPTPVRPVPDRDELRADVL
jgi:hypothetical protein